MIAELANLVEQFPGAPNQTRCFLHILNLVVKSIIRQFDLPKARGDAILDEAKAELQNLAGNLEVEELVSQQDCDSDDDDDSVEGWVDEREEMTEIEIEELDESVGPLRLILTKVSVRIWLSLNLDNDLPSVAAKNCFRYQKFNNINPSQMV
jgi:hypothetical protein